MKKFGVALGLLLASSSAQAESFVQTVSLSPMEAWHCDSQQQQARAFAEELVAFQGHDCADFLSNSRAIFQPLKNAASFSTTNIYRQCYSEALRDQLSIIADRVVTSCLAESSQSEKAGVALGRTACRLATEGSLTPDLDLGLIEGSYFDPNGQKRSLKVVVPVRSDVWAAQLSASQESGFDIGCVLGEADSIRQIPVPDQSAEGIIDWFSIGKKIGTEFGAVYCPMEASRSHEILRVLTASSADDSAKVFAEQGFEEGFKTLCNMGQP